MIGFNKPYLTGKETHNIFKAVYEHCHISGNILLTSNILKTLAILTKKNTLV